jgi:Putative prokaryotic signal transducing protein
MGVVIEYDMNDEQRELKKIMSESADQELLRIVYIDYADYRHDALDSAKQELAARGIPFDESRVEREMSEPEIPPNVELVTAASFSAPYEAHLAKGQLEANGIMAVIADEYTAGMNWLFSNAIGGVKVQVDKPDLEDALKILALSGQQEGDALEVDDSWGECPKCGSKTVEFILERKGPAVLTWLLIGIPLLFASKKLRCLNCNNDWKYK